MTPRPWQILWLTLVATFLFLGLKPAAGPPPASRIDLFAHALINLLLGAIAYKAFSFPRAFLLALAGLVVLGGAIELLQHFSVNREPSWVDFLADLGGIAFAGLVALLIEKVRGGRREVAGSAGPR